MQTVSDAEVQKILKSFRKELLELTDSDWQVQI
jgi:hypothetical protein